MPYIYEPKGKAFEYGELALNICACGCGKPVRPKWKYFYGHKKYGKDVKRTDEYKANLSKLKIGKKRPFPTTEEEKERMRLVGKANKGTRLSTEHKIKIGISGRGRIISEETRQKFIGKKQSIETRRKKSIIQKGENGSNWRGGVSAENDILRQSMDFKIWRREVFKKDNYTCQHCGTKYIKKSPPNLHPHHIMAFAKYPELRFEVSNGITLCVDCHSRVHGRRIG
jgi:hypothetical protein